MESTATQADADVGVGVIAEAWVCPFCPLLCHDVRPEVRDGDGWRLAADTPCARADGALAALQPPAMAPRADPIEAGARLLRAARRPLFAGLGTDVAGARALTRLAAACGAVIDGGGAGPLRTLRSLQDRGGYSTTLAEVALHADLIVTIGFDPAQRQPRFWQRVQGDPAARVVALASADLFTELALLAALVAGRHVIDPPPSLQALAEQLRAARYAVLVWEPAALPAQGELLIELLQRLIGTLNQHTRAAGLALGGDNGLASVQQAHLWLTGLPLATAHGPRGLEHDPWCFDAPSLVQGGAVDAVLWVDAFGQQPLPPELLASPLPLLLLATPQRLAALPVRAAATVAIAVGTPAVDHGGHLFRTEFSVVQPLRALRPSTLPSVAEVLLQMLTVARGTRTHPDPLPQAGEGAR